MIFGKEDVAVLEERLKGIKYDEVEVEKALADFPVSDYLGRITKEEFLTCLFDN